MKRILAMALAVMMMFTLVACGSSPSEPASGSGSAESGEAKEGSTKKAAAAYSMEETVLVDTDQCAFTITDVSENGSSVNVSVICENKSDAVLMFAWDNVAVNGCMIDPFWASEVAAGKKSSDKLSFSKSDLQQYGLSAMDELQFDLHIYDSEDLTAESLVDERFSIYPTGLAADSVSYPDYAASDSDTIIADNEYATFVITDVDEDDVWGYTVKAYILNKTDSTVTCAWDDVSVNDFMCDPFWAMEIAPNARAFVDITFTDSALEEAGVDEVENIEFRLHFYDDAHWDNYFIDEVYTYNP